MYLCFIFDLDGTIINTIESLAYTVSVTMEELGYGPIDEEHTKVFVGDGYKKLIERSLLYWGDIELKHYERALEIYNRNFAQYCLYKISPYKGMKEFLQLLKNRKIKLAVVTNKAYDRAVECVERVYGKNFFDAILGDGMGYPCKPDPAGVFSIMNQLGVKPEECLYFGDTNTDMETGKNAGLDTVGVTWGFRTREELEHFAPKYVIDSPKEAESLFLSAENKAVRE